MVKCNQPSLAQYLLFGRVGGEGKGGGLHHMDSSGFHFAGIHGDGGVLTVWQARQGPYMELCTARHHRDDKHEIGGRNDPLGSV